MALSEALSGLGMVSPNPLVGAVVVKNNRIIGKGAHFRYGSHHAEVNALNSCTESPSSSDMYVTLEPCDHYGKTPPCSLKIIEAGIKRVIIGTTDLNSLVNGKGIKRLLDAGIEVVTGVLESECREQNRAFFHYCQTGRPLITLKMATSIDGCLAAEGGNSKWISSETSRISVHRMRAEMDAVMVGRTTALNDNPKLDARMVNGRAPYRIILDSKLSLPENLQIFNDELTAKTIITTTHDCIKSKKEFLLSKKIQVIEVAKDQNNLLNIHEIINKLSELHFNSILIEGGSQLASSLLRAKLADRLVLFIAPVLLGCHEHALHNLGIKTVAEGIHLINRVVSQSGDDLAISADLDYTSFII